MARAARFKIWASRGRFHTTVVLGNASRGTGEAFPTAKAAIAAVTEQWLAAAKALGVYGKHTKATFLATHPVPYTKDSLQPAMTKPTTLAKRAKKVARKIQRIAAIEKIVEGAKIAKTDLPALAAKPRRRRAAATA